MAKPLTAAAVAKLKAGAQRREVRDAACPGLCLRITPKGIKTFAFVYRDKTTSKVTWLTIGRYPDVLLADARVIANDARKAVTNGGIPLAPKVRRAEAEKKRRRTTTSSRSITTPS